MTLKEIENKYILTADYHTHTVYSHTGPHKHGKGTIMDNVRTAAVLGLEEIAITDHGPANLFGLDPARIPKMRSDIETAMKECPGIKVYLGVEADIIDSENGLDVTARDFELYDFVNAGYHYVPGCKRWQNLMAFRGAASKNRVERLRIENTERIIRALRSNDIRILTHPGDKAPIDEAALAAACADTNTLVEINARHIHPDLHDLKIYAAYDVKFAIGSDAHRPEQIGNYTASLALAFEAGIDADRIVNIRER